MKKTTKIGIVLTSIVLLLSFSVLIVKHYKKISEIGVPDTIPYGFGKDATVILLAGQSNASGWSRDDYLQKNVSEEKYAEYEHGYDNVYINFRAASNNSKGFVPCSVRQGEGLDATFFGPELGLAEKLNELYPDRTIFVIKFAWGGTDLYEEWRSPSSGGEEGPLYRSFVEHVKTSVAYLEAKNYNVSIDGMCWMQGESDSTSDEATLEYEKNLSCLIDDVRREFADHASEDGIAFIDAYIMDIIFWKNYAQINQAKQNVADSSEMNAVIDTIAHGLCTTEEPEEEPDLAHFDSLSAIKLGHLFAEEVSKFFD